MQPSLDRCIFRILHAVPRSFLRTGALRPTCMTAACCCEAASACAVLEAESRCAWPSAWK